MPKLEIAVESPIQTSFRVEQIRGMFDVPDQKVIRHEWSVDLPIEKLDWQIGLLVGPSGSGKSVLARRLFPEAYFHEGYKWPKEAAVVDGFPKGLDGKSITQALSSVGFSSPPHWLKRYDHLSNGQKFRCELARLMLEDHEVAIFDEFTSVVDRDAAKISSAAVAKALRRRGKPRLIALSCHYDVIDWLDPDWIYNTADGSFARRSLQCRPPIQLTIHPASSRAWRLFSGHHYLSRRVHVAARCFVAAWNGNPVAFTSYLHLPHTKIRNLKKEHRTVVLPDYQGVGIGNALSEWLGEYVRGRGFRFYSTTSHPAMIRHRMKSREWRTIRPPSHIQSHNHDNRTGGGFSKTGSSGRITASFEYVGESRPGPR